MSVSSAAVSVPTECRIWQVKVEQMALELRLTPLTVLLRSVLDQLQEKDPARIFAQPVSLKEVSVHPLGMGLPGGLGSNRSLLGAGCALRGLLAFHFSTFPFK